MRRAEIIDALWPDADERSGADNLRGTLRRLRDSISADEDGGPDGDGGDDGERAEGRRSVIDADGDRIDLRWELIELDTVAFEAAVEAGRQAEVTGAIGDALAYYRAAADRYRGDHLAGLEEPWAGRDRLRLRSAFVRSAVRAGELLTATGALRDAMALAGRAVEVEPRGEPAHRLLARLLIDSGREDDAAALLDELLGRLRADRVRPEPATVGLRDRIAAG